MYEHEKIDYVELPSNNFAKTKAFFGEVFGWQLEDAGSDYLAFTGEGVDGGFYRTDVTMSQANGSALVIFYSNQLEATEQKIIAASGEITRPTTHFPGGRRFHFADPNGNEFAVWSDREIDGSQCS